MLTTPPGLPGGIFSNQKFPIWVSFGGPWNGKVWCILWPFGNLAAIWYFFQHLGQEKSGNPGFRLLRLVQMGLEINPCQGGSFQTKSNIWPLNMYRTALNYTKTSKLSM
jgi:hypothetical protein